MASSKHLLENPHTRLVSNIFQIWKLEVYSGNHVPLSLIRNQQFSIINEKEKLVTYKFDYEGVSQMLSTILNLEMMFPTS